MITPPEREARTGARADADAAILKDQKEVLVILELIEHPSSLILNLDEERAAILVDGTKDFMPLGPPTARQTQSPQQRVLMREARVIYLHDIAKVRDAREERCQRQEPEDAPTPRRRILPHDEAQARDAEREHAGSDHSRLPADPERRVEGHSLTRWPAEEAAGQEMHVDVEDGLPGAFAAIHDEAIALSLSQAEMLRRAARAGHERGD